MMTLANLALFTSSLLGFIALSLAMPRHSEYLLRRKLPILQLRLLRFAGWLLIISALAIGITQWRFGIGTVTWLGWLSLAGLALVFYLPHWPWQTQKPHKARAESAGSGALLLHRYKTAAIITFLLLLGIFTWQLLQTPQKPLLRDDAIHGQIGPWSFVLAEFDQKPPEIMALGVPLKTFTIRFCQGCDGDIRMAYLKIREPRSLRTAGNGFEGRRPEKTVEIPVPFAATLNDGIWLTVEGTNGEVYQQSFTIQQLSPALATFIQERL